MLSDAVPNLKSLDTIVGNYRALLCNDLDDKDTRKWDENNKKPINKNFIQDHNFQKIMSPEYEIPIVKSRIDGQEFYIPLANDNEHGFNAYLGKRTETIDKRYPFHIEHDTTPLVVFHYSDKCQSCLDIRVTWNTLVGTHFKHIDFLTVNGGAENMNYPAKFNAFFPEDRSVPFIYRLDTADNLVFYSILPVGSRGKESMEQFVTDAFDPEPFQHEKEDLLRDASQMSLWIESMVKSK